MVEEQRAPLSQDLASGSGWFAATIDGCLRVSYLDHRLSLEGAAELLANLDDDIATWPADRSRVVLYEAQSLSGVGPGYRRQVAAVLSRHAAKLDAVTRGFCLVTPSTIVRGLLTATYWLAPPGYATRVTASTGEGLTWLGGRVGRSDIGDWFIEYDALRAAYRQDAERSFSKVSGT